MQVKKLALHQDGRVSRRAWGTGFCTAAESTQVLGQTKSVPSQPCASAVNGQHLL